MPRVEIGITDDAFADTARAATIVAGLQRLSALPIDTSVVSLEDAITSPNPAVLISADKWTDDRMTLPIDASDDIVRLDGQGDSGEPVSLTLNPRLRFGSLQTLYTDDRTVLVATSNDSPAQLDALLSWLDSDPRRWDRLKGAAVIAPQGLEPVTIAAEAVPPPKPDLQQGGSTRYWLIGAGVIAAVLLGLGVIYLRTRNQPGS